MNIQELFTHPEIMNRETLYELRRITALYPYYQGARLLLLKNLYLLHDPTFDEELRRSAIYFTDRRILFNLVEAAHYRLKRKSPQDFSTQPDRRAQEADAGNEAGSRTVSLIDTFLSNVPEENPDEGNNTEGQQGNDKKKRVSREPNAADATVDYVAYLLSTDFEELEQAAADSPADKQKNDNAGTMNGEDLINAFINNDGGRFTLQDEPQNHPEMQLADNGEEEPEEEILTETLAGIYIKQGRYQKALDIMNKINETSQKKNMYFEDQQRFLKKLIKNQTNN